MLQPQPCLLRPPACRCEKCGLGCPFSLHGYAYPVPDGRGYRIITTKRGPWLRKAFEQKRYKYKRRSDIGDNALRYAPVITKLNEELRKLCRPWQGVYVMDFRRGLPNPVRDEKQFRKFVNDGTHTYYWADELHLESVPAKHLAAKISVWIEAVCDLGVLRDSLRASRRVAVSVDGNGRNQFTIGDGILQGFTRRTRLY